MNADEKRLQGALRYARRSHMASWWTWNLSVGPCIYGVCPRVRKWFGEEEGRLFPDEMLEKMFGPGGG